MSDIDRTKLEDIYTSYGFEVDNTYESIAVFAYKKGRYFGADIIPIAPDIDLLSKAEEIKNSYSEAGYAATVKNVSCIQEAELELFKSFFSFDATLERLRKKYSDFKKKQSQNLLGNEYQYIRCPFEIYESDKNDEDDFISLVKNIIIDDNSPHLVIIEAAAGYGKTSTVFELLNSIVSDSEINKIPIITELARNRGATIFKYVLLDEIDTEFQTLNSTLVIKEIKEGRIPVIIDGFDELLTKISLEADISTIEEVEPMLNTISNLLERKAKIIITTRKTAIFNGSEFEKWKEQCNTKFLVTRFSIKEPSISDWLGEKKCSILERKNVKIDAISNPVILSYLRNISEQEFEEETSQSENLVNQYFKKMLEREQERQQLIMSSENQFEVFKNVVRLLAELDTATESKAFFKEIIRDQNIRLLEASRALYSEKPTIDNLVDRLATHALLDRKGRGGNQIGFINDFVFGIFIGEIIIEISFEETEQVDLGSISAYMIELAVTAFKVQNPRKKLELWRRLMSIHAKFLPYTIFNYDIILKNAPARNYIDLDIKELSFYNLHFKTYTISNTVFVNCAFKMCTFDPDLFYGVSFINCTFEDCYCTSADGYFDKYYDKVNVINCSEKNCHILIETEMYEINEFQLAELQEVILSMMWSFSHLKKHLISSLIRKIENISHKKIATAITDLESKKFIKIRGNIIEYNLNKINEIKSLLKKV